MTSRRSVQLPVIYYGCTRVKRSRNKWSAVCWCCFSIMRSIAISVSVCLCFVCLFVGLSTHISHTSKFQEILFACYLWPWLDPPLTTVHTLFVYDVIFYIMQGIRQHQRQHVYVSSSSPGDSTSRTSDVWPSALFGGTGGQVYRFRLHLV